MESHGVPAGESVDGTSVAGFGLDHAEYSARNSVAGHVDYLAGRIAGKVNPADEVNEWGEGAAEIAAAGDPSPVEAAVLA